jgi:hypothetical protein
MANNGDNGERGHPRPGNFEADDELTAQDIRVGPYNRWVGPNDFAITEFFLPVGPYRGHGPRRAQPSDRQIEDQVCHRMTQHGQLDAHDIDVSVMNGEVTLRGTVDSRWAKRLARDIADSVPGTQDVHNDLKITPPAGERST